MASRVALTKGEQLYILRRRKGLSQAAFAKRYGVTHDVLSEIEKGRRPMLAKIRPGGYIAPTVGERVTVLRRRLGYTIRELAEEMGMSHITLIAREGGKGNAWPILHALEHRVRSKYKIGGTIYDA